MTEEFKSYLKEIQEIKNKVHKINNNSDKESCEKVKTLEETLDSLSNYYISQIPNCEKLKLTKDIVIKKGENIKLETNIDVSNLDLDNNQIIFDGYSPMDGFLIIYTSRDNEGNLSIYAKNNIPDEYIDSFCKYKFCDSDMNITRLSGKFKLGKDSTIGIVMSNKQKYEKSLIKSRD